jgi:hypothetical protein
MIQGRDCASSAASYDRDSFARKVHAIRLKSMRKIVFLISKRDRHSNIASRITATTTGCHHRDARSVRDRMSDA